MKAEEILKLVEAGFTKSDILKLAGAKDSAAKETDPAVEAGTEQIEEKPSVDVPKSEGTVGDTVMADMVKSLNESILSLQKTMQQANLQNASSETTPRSIDEMADDAIFSLLE